MPAGAASSRSGTRDAAYERISSIARGSNERRPRIIAIVTGKNVRYVAMITTEMTFAPNANTIIGARATIGMVWLAMTYGTSARSSSREWTKSVARTSPSSAPSEEPDRRLAPGVERRADEELGDGLVRAALQRLGEREGDVPDVGQRSGRSRTASGTAGSRGSATARQRPRRPPRRAAEELDALPQDEDRDDEQPRTRDAAWRRPRPGRSSSADRGRADAAAATAVAIALARSPPGRRCRAPRSMISKPSPSCSSVMHSGGFVWIELLAIIVYSPFSRKNLPIAFISSVVPLNGVSGVQRVARCGRGRGSRTGRGCGRAPTDGCFAYSALVVAAHDRAEPARRSRSARPPRRPRWWRARRRS